MLLIAAIIVSSITVASIPGGMLWVAHDMMAGFVPSRERAISYLYWGALSGLQFGWLIVATSFPYSALGAVVAYFVTDQGFRKKEKEA